MNLDAMDQDDLLALYGRLSEHLLAEARTLFPDRPKGYVKAARTLAQYADDKATAIKHRLAGRIAVALQHETICDRLYDQLPKFARW